jgi:hypothetical protein
MMTEGMFVLTSWLPVIGIIFLGALVVGFCMSVIYWWHVKVKKDW